MTNTAATDTSDATSCCDTAPPSLDAEHAAGLAARLAAVADPTRLQVLSMIGAAEAGEVCACDFVAPLGKSQPTISHHLKVLSEAGFIEGDKRGRWIWYRLRPAAIDAVVSTLATLSGPEA